MRAGGLFGFWNKFKSTGSFAKFPVLCPVVVPQNSSLPGPSPI
jgi:hypothetical protein